MMILFMSDKALLASLDFILESIGIIAERFENIGQADDFVKTSQGRTYYDAILMRIQTIGEKLKTIHQKNPKLFEKYSEVSWNEIIRFRELISHHNEKLIHEAVYDVCKFDLPVLKSAIEKIIGDLKEKQ